jgi:hypothetical protein
LRGNSRNIQEPKSVYTHYSLEMRFLKRTQVRRCLNNVTVKMDKNANNAINNKKGKTYERGKSKYGKHQRERVAQ